VPVFDQLSEALGKSVIYAMYVGGMKSPCNQKRIHLDPKSLSGTLLPFSPDERLCGWGWGSANNGSL
jgi:hypothetical protein